MKDKLKLSINVFISISIMLLLAVPAVPTLAGGDWGNGGRPVASLDISKDVSPVYAPGSSISLEKTASESSIYMSVGESREVIFMIEVEADNSDSYYIAKNIYVENTGEWPANVTAVSDTGWFRAGGPRWYHASTSVVTTMPIGQASMPTGGPYVYAYSGTFTLPAPMSSITSMSNLIKITIDNHAGDGVHIFHNRQDFQKPQGGDPGTVLLEDIETITPVSGLDYVVDAVAINGSPASLTGPWSLDLAHAPYAVEIVKTLTAQAAGEYALNNKAIIGELSDEADVLISVNEPERLKGTSRDISGRTRMATACIRTASPLLPG
ncbi:MAG: hypothetical protein SWK76_03825 [Actinomycetota bacterium]|nr:hypothetical protein [Actinomycetota bacterium]